MLLATAAKHLSRQRLKNRGPFPLVSPFGILLCHLSSPSRFIGRETGSPPCFRSLLVSVPLPFEFLLGFPVAAASEETCHGSVH